MLFYEIVQYLHLARLVPPWQSHEQILQGLRHHTSALYEPCKLFIVMSVVFSVLHAHDSSYHAQTAGSHVRSLKTAIERGSGIPNTDLVIESSSTMT